MRGGAALHVFFCLRQPVKLDIQRVHICVCVGGNDVFDFCRAAFDFLELRLVASEGHAEDVAFWREAQAQSGEELAATLGVAPAADAILDEDAPPSKRRRRRRRRSTAASPE